MKCCGSKSLANDFRVAAGDTTDVVDVVSAAATEPDLDAVSEPSGCEGDLGSLLDAYRHSLSDLAQVTQRGRVSSHFTRRFRHVRLHWSVGELYCNAALVHINRRRAYAQKATGNAMRMQVDGIGRAYHPVVVRSPRAREGRGFRGLGTPVVVTGIASGDAA